MDSISRDDLYDWAEHVLKPAALEADEGNGEFHAGHWCRFCKARHICRERAKKNLELAAYEFAAPPLLSDEEIVEILEKVDSLLRRANDVKEYALQEAVAGKKWDGYKLVEGRSVRKYTSEKSVAEAAAAAGYDPYEKRVLGVTEMQKIKEELKTKMQELTALENPNSVSQLSGWLADNGVETDSLGKKQVKALMEEVPEEIREVLRLRQQLAKSSVKKYQAMKNAACSDGRARGMFMFYGANRTGRFSGRLIQMQNLPQNHLPDLAEARALVRQGNLEAVKMLYGDVPDTLSQLIRTAFIPREGARFYVADFSAIEARVLSWIAGEEWRMEVFASGGDIYCATASRMFGVPVVKHGENGELRQKGKQAELSCGYGGSVGALKAMGALELGMKEEELKPLVDSWRSANPNIVRLWGEIERAAIHVIKTKEPQQVKCLRFTYQSGFLFIQLPSGRKLAYVKPRLGENQFGGTSITYEGVGGTKKWERLESFGGKLTENVIQAISRDILCYAMRTLRCCSIVMHVHDARSSGRRWFHLHLPCRYGRAEL